MPAEQCRQPRLARCSLPDSCPRHGCRRPADPAAAGHVRGRRRGRRFPVHSAALERRVQGRCGRWVGPAPAGNRLAVSDRRPLLRIGPCACRREVEPADVVVGASGGNSWGIRQSFWCVRVALRVPAALRLTVCVNVRVAAKPLRLSTSSRLLEVKLRRSTAPAIQSSYVRAARMRIGSLGVFSA